MVVAVVVVAVVVVMVVEGHYLNALALILPRPFPH